MVTIASLIENEAVNLAVASINHKKTQICVEIERLFLQTLEGGCTAPIGALAEFINEKEIQFSGRLSSLDGQKTLDVQQTFTYESNADYGVDFAQKILKQGGDKIMAELKNNL